MDDVGQLDHDIADPVTEEQLLKWGFASHSHAFLELRRGSKSNKKSLYISIEESKRTKMVASSPGLKKKKQGCEVQKHWQRRRRISHIITHYDILKSNFNNSGAVQFSIHSKVHAVNSSFQKSEFLIFDLSFNRFTYTLLIWIASKNLLLKNLLTSKTF